MTLNHHAERVTGQRYVDARGIQQRGETGIVDGQAGDLLAALLHLLERFGCFQENPIGAGLHALVGAIDRLR